MFKKLIYCLCGRFKPFWLCDETSALIVSFNRENVIYCKYNNNIQISHSAIEHLAIFLDDKVIYTKIVGHKINDRNIELTLKEPIIGRVKKIAYLIKYRLDADSITIEYSTNQKATSEIPIVEVFND
ncbi:hypothetical protein J3U11_06835 [Gilliamella sp. B2840]|uniref:hypothetical protein n=1 Tax=Gilliamella sp. B2840 TaxID=2817975 RepID=UPI00226AC3C1|nr:hypothetical protein [Gilliamella sp. B2840]MCX8700782.1 hypothetical protein [Gilliamella sp. B2840]